jgi:methyltransferase family protein
MESRENQARAPPSWAGLARHWQAVATPLRPSIDDAAYVQRVIDGLAAEIAAPCVLLLGVTPELSTLRFPADAALLAVDSSPEMLAAWWTPPLGCRSLALRGRWQTLPIRAASIDLVLADASFCALPDVAGMSDVLAAVAAVLRPGALLCGRTFVSPPRAERIEDVLTDLRAGRAGSVHAAKWRVAMALQGGAEHGVALAEVWKVFESAGERRELGARNGWCESSMATLDAYRGVSSRLCFPTFARTRELFAVHFDELECRLPDYELGERCPMLLMRRRGKA